MSSNVGVKPSDHGRAVQVATDEIVSGNSAIHYPLYKVGYGAAGSFTPASVTNPFLVQDPWLQHAIDVIASTYGDTVNVYTKSKDLLKFGESDQVQTTLSTVMDLPTGTFNETFVSDNLITTISSDVTADAQPITIEGHTISGSNLTFVSQTVTSNGVTQVSLTTPLARCTRMFNAGTSDLVGNVYAYEDDTDTAGVPDTDSKVHCIIPAGFNQSRKCSTSLSSQDYWIVTSINASLLTKASAFITAELEIRQLGKVFRSQTTFGTDNGSVQYEFKPYLIVPKNSDIRIRAAADQNGRSVSANISGVLAIVV